VVRIWYPIEISYRFAVFENLNDSKDIKRAWKNFKGISKPQLKGV